MIQIPILMQAEPSYKERTDLALRECHGAGCTAVYMPQIADARIIAPEDDEAWTLWWTSMSLKLTGTVEGQNVDVYAHVPHHFCNPDKIQQAIEQGLVKGAGVTPQEELERLHSLKDDDHVFAIDREELMQWPAGVYGIDEPTKDHQDKYNGVIDGKPMTAINHPQTIPFIGSKAPAYLQKHKEVLGPKIGIWCVNDLTEDKALARLLVTGGNYGDGLDGDLNLDDCGRFAGVRAEGAAREFPALEEIMSTLGPFIPTAAEEGAREAIRSLLR